MGLTLTKEEAAIALSALVAFDDDEVSDVEAGIMRAFYLPEDADSLVTKMENAGVRYPTGLEATEEHALAALRGAPLGYRLRTIAIGYRLARADGIVSETEFERLDRYGREIGVTYEGAKQYGAHHLREIDPENKDNWVEVDAVSDVRLSLEEAGVAFAALVAFRDDQLTDAEAVVMRKYYRMEHATGLQEKLEAVGKAYPSALSEIEPVVMRTLSFGTREFRLRTLAIALKLAEADGTVDEGEIKLIQDYGKRFGIAMYETMHYRKKRLHEVMT